MKIKKIKETYETIKLLGHIYFIEKTCNDEEKKELLTTRETLLFNAKRLNIGKIIKKIAKNNFKKPFKKLNYNELNKLESAIDSYENLLEEILDSAKKYNNKNVFTSKKLDLPNIRYMYKYFDDTIRLKSTEKKDFLTNLILEESGVLKKYKYQIHMMMLQYKSEQAGIISTIFNKTLKSKYNNCIDKIDKNKKYIYKSIELFQEEKIDKEWEKIRNILSNLEKKSAEMKLFKNIDDKAIKECISILKFLRSIKNKPLSSERKLAFLFSGMPINIKKAYQSFFKNIKDFATFCMKAKINILSNKLKKLQGKRKNNNDNNDFKLKLKKFNREVNEINAYICGEKFGSFYIPPLYSYSNALKSDCSFKDLISKTKKIMNPPSLK